MPNVFWNEGGPAVTHRGGCHCGNLRYALESRLALTELPLRACQCSFCRAHGAVSTSDPAGRISLEIRVASRVTRYRFGLRLADFLICAQCGVYVAARMRDETGDFAVINANTLDEVAKLTQAVTPHDYDGEDAAARTARRRSRWTPVAP